jgi:hypothetical protein
MKVVKGLFTVAAMTVALGAPLAHAQCVKKGAIATAGSEESAKWYALETTVQAVSWGLWPGFLANGKVEGYNVSDRYSCKPDGGQVTCRAAVTFCKK